MAVKNIITQGIGANPGGLLWFMTGGLEAGEAITVPPFGVATSLLTGLPISTHHTLTSLSGWCGSKTLVFGYRGEA
jgi:hypothetical protein